VEGFTEANPALDPQIQSATIAILVGFFAVQSHGTEKVGRVFDPIMLVWLLVAASILHKVHQAIGDASLVFCLRSIRDSEWTA
jgi:K+ transporter